MNPPKHPLALKEQFTFHCRAGEVVIEALKEPS